MEFTWDPAKAATNARKHGVSFSEAVTVFADPLAIIVEDAKHAERSILIGESTQQRVLFTVYVEIEEDKLRIISARRATRRERQRYEED